MGFFSAVELNGYSCRRRRPTRVLSAVPIYCTFGKVLYRKFKDKGRFRKPERPEDYIALHQTPGAQQDA